MSNVNIKQIRIPVRLPKGLQEELGKSVLGNSYGFKGRSKWVEESIEHLLEKTDFCQLTVLDDTINAHLIADAFNISPKVRDKIENALIKIKTTEPTFNVTISSIVRTSIIQRLLRHNAHPVDNATTTEETL